MLSRQERIEKAIENLPTKKAKDTFVEFAERYADMSVFWNEEDETASLESAEMRIEIS